MRDPELKALVEHIGYDEGMPVVVDPRILNPRAFLQEVLEQRLPNPFIPDTPQRIATDTSQKVPIRFGETIKAYARRQDLEVTHLTFSPGDCRLAALSAGGGRPGQGHGVQQRSHVGCPSDPVGRGDVG
jgi:mannitol-1-phosphate/altronate dehydrogenase